MTGETDLGQLLSTMEPMLLPDSYVFVSLPANGEPPAGIAPVMLFHEAEGVTAILPASNAEALALRSTFRCRMITLAVHSSLVAVGFLAAITTRLAAAHIGVNPVSAYHHDHLFVPEDRAEEAMTILRELSAQGA